MVLHAVIGDVHGCYDALRALEDRIARHAERRGMEPRFVLLGDLVDRGPCSAQVVRHARLGQAAGTHLSLMGNHEQMMLLTLAHFAPRLFERAGASLPSFFTPIAVEHARKTSFSARWLPEATYCQFQMLSWLAQGGAPTLSSWGTLNVSDPKAWTVDPDDLAWLSRLPLVWRHGGVVVTHGLPSADALADLESEDPSRRDKAVATVLWSRTRPPSPPAPGFVHVSGHTPLPRVHRRSKISAIQIDTGAFLGRRLSAWCVETDRVVSVPSAKV